MRNALNRALVCALVMAAAPASLAAAETADALGLSLRSVQRAFMRARAWLRTELVSGRQERNRD